MLNKTIISKDIEDLINRPIPWELLDNRVYLISGATSFLMSYLIRVLLERNKRFGSNTTIYALCRNMISAKKKMEEYDDSNLIWLECPEFPTLTKLPQSFDYCIHAASPAGKSNRHDEPIVTWDVNVGGCRALLQASRDGNASRFLLISSVDVYGKKDGTDRLSEEMLGYLSINRIRNVYSNAKRASECLCTLFNEVNALETIVARPFQVFGPGMALDDGRLHGDYIKQIKESGKIRLLSDGTAKRSFLYLSDATDALLRILAIGQAGGTYNVCSEAGEASVRELAELYVKAFGRESSVEFDYNSRNSIEVKEALSIVLGESSKLRKLDWDDKISLEEGIRRCLKHYDCIV